MTTLVHVVMVGLGATVVAKSGSRASAPRTGRAHLKLSPAANLRPSVSATVSSKHCSSPSAISRAPPARSGSLHVGRKDETGCCYCMVELAATAELCNRLFNQSCFYKLRSDECVPMHNVQSAHDRLACLAAISLLWLTEVTAMMIQIHSPPSRHLSTWLLSPANCVAPPK